MKQATSPINALNPRLCDTIRLEVLPSEKDQMDLQSKKRKQPCQNNIESDTNSCQLMHQDFGNELAIVPQAEGTIFGAVSTSEDFVIPVHDLNQKKKMKPEEYIFMDITDEELKEGNGMGLEIEQAGLSDHHLELTRIAEWPSNSRSTGCPEEGGPRYPFLV